MVRQDVRYFASELDDGRYVNVPATGRDDDRYVTFLQPDEITIGTCHFCNCPRRESVLFPEMTANSFDGIKVFRQM